MKQKIAIVLALLLALLQTGCSQRPIAAQSFALDTLLSVTLYEGGSMEIAQEALTIADESERVFSARREGAELYAVNEARGGELSASLCRAIEKGLFIAEQSGGAFDIGLGAISSLWNFSGESPSLPDEGALADAVPLSGYEQISLGSNTLAFANDAVQIDLGAIAKGFIGDQMKAYLIENGVSSALLNLGGNIVLIGQKDGGDFAVGIENPNNTSKVAGALFASDICISTSSGAQRYFELDGKRYHHIIDRETGYPADSGLASVTILHKEAAVADALSTACFVLGEERALAFLNEHYPGIHAVFIRSDGSVFATDGTPFKQE